MYCHECDESADYVFTHYREEEHEPGIPVLDNKGNQVYGVILVYRCPVCRLFFERYIGRENELGNDWTPSHE